MNRIRKERKACWVYQCELCSVSASAPDLFRAQERQQAHEGTMSHRYAAFSKEFRELGMDLIRQLRREFGRQA